jgi:predicted amidohydrolase
MPDNCLHQAEPIDGPLVKSIQKIALQYGMNIVLPFHESRGGLFYNTVAVVSRSGKLVGTYSKIYPVFGNSSQTIPPTQQAEVAAPDSVTPAASGVQYFDLDFGRIGVLICYDINFAELWLQSEALGIDMLVWPSAMATPDPSTYGKPRCMPPPP